MLSQEVSDGPYKGTKGKGKGKGKAKGKGKGKGKIEDFEEPEGPFKGTVKNHLTETTGFIECAFG